MKTTTKISIFTLFISQCGTSLAAETRATKVELNDLERITVTANRKESLDTDLAMSVHSIGKEELAIDNGQHVAESLNSLSGVFIDQLSGGQGHKASIRMPINTSGYYLYLQDNIPLQSPAFFNHNALWWSSFNSNVSRMEVLKGAGTALYGSGAVAATINILSADVAEQAETSMDLMLDEDKYSKIQLNHSNTISDEQGFRLAGSYLNNEGWREHTGSKRAEVTFRHELEISSNEHLVTSFVISDLEQEMAASLSEDLYKTDKTHSGLSEEVLASDPLRKTAYMRLSAQWDKTDGNYFYSVIPYYRSRTNDYTATWNQNMPKVESEVKTFGLLALASFEHHDGSETIIGTDIEFTEGRQLSYQPLDFTTSGWGADTFTKGEKFYDDTTKYLGLSPYIQHTRTLSDNLDLTLGARYDYAQYEFDNNLSLYGDIGHGHLSLENRDDDFTHLSPKASLNYHLGDDSSLYLRYANSFRLPTASSLYHLTTKDDGNAKAVDPEVSNTFELGYKVNLEKVNFDFAVYYMDVDDGIVQAYNDAGQRYLTNASRVIHQGFEAAMLWQISEKFNLSTAYTQAKHEFDQHDEYSGNEMAMAPDYIVNVRLRYQPSLLLRFISMLEVQSIGKYWLDDANSRDDEGNDRIYQGYTIINLKARYQVSKKLALHARLLNLSDKEYAQEASYRYGKTTYSPGAPRTVYFGLNYQW
ncbi:MULTISPECIES: TonB-dependent receptor [unclassified Colwellia]|uniref:TonB-dependent receptor n=1 Tax=unclassified Colwellia TaxID=196834 RepID=UPI0015F58138|nr:MULTISPECIES: TonB-dependent receptor [unclassified Colwellia]MBA6232652.1 TonB-dependent receptor [Colwellia sp. MB02u-7]MBA6235207.1 TonB-dependent receptor [Colwellia sp. MB02u-11]MBA6257971.1 TonB-dependent receptor [Colwellia sp. MB3u-28]MBA6258349.1 TonB-dependent receptor [Colwellia sp. MB3u-41]MBA6299257.1 TonB-dependent receptor [Colwellia sp. MB3u-22]